MWFNYFVVNLNKKILTKFKYFYKIIIISFLLYNKKIINIFILFFIFKTIIYIIKVLFSKFDIIIINNFF